MTRDLFCWWEVTAGFRPGAAADRFNETFPVARDEWNNGDLAGRRLRQARQEEAIRYAESLMADEAICWVHLTYDRPDAPWAHADEDTPGTA